ncbi:MAG: diguanylate cyclase [Desulfuromonas sp.]|nr:diguanylate cyclase [Desulfuromonas sp.]
MVPTFSSTNFVKKYLTSIFLIICVIILSVFLGFNYKANSLIKEQMQHQGKAFFQEVVLTRQWIAQHGGVYVKRTAEMTPNPYLLQVPNFKVCITDQDGEDYILKNPALVTREISALAKQDGLFTFHITSLNPLNPDNKPDSFEREALEKFAQGEEEYFIYSQHGADFTFRYMAALKTTAACLRCHAGQGYRLGDIRGGISINIPATRIIAEMKHNHIALIASALGTVLLIFAIIVYISRIFIYDIRQAENRLIRMASHDFLTGLINRREAYNRLERACARSDRSNAIIGILLLDIDHFKQVNDEHGHSVGDTVLKALANSMLEALRDYDIICRFGGEEFLIALPDTAPIGIYDTAERLRKAIEKMRIELPDGTTLHVSVSIGISHRGRDENIDQAISRADDALYLAKNAGRNRVVTAQEAEDIP